jgi:predicted patatin/cPLA2 family phospholipase
MRCKYLSPILVILSMTATLGLAMTVAGDCQTPAGDTAKRLLVISGGGARGAWGVGVLSELTKRNGRYKAVFGTSTGSLMAPMILLQDMDILDSAYTNVTQESIFNKSPFNVDYNATTGTVTTSMNFRAIWRFIIGKKTFGETKNLLNLIHQFLTRPRYDSLIRFYRDSQMVMAVAVTDTKTGLLKMVYDSTFTDTDTAYENLCRWIWASANEPLYMSYVKMGDSYYVDGGVREVIPIQEALLYAIKHDIDYVDVVINNSKVPINQDWNVNAGGILNGLERLLGIYDLGTVHYNETYAMLLARYFNKVAELPPPDPLIGYVDSISKINPDATIKLSELRKLLPIASGQNRRMVHMKFYCMPDSLAQKYADELGVVKPAMLVLLQQGKLYGADPAQNCFEINIDRETMRRNPGMFNQ